MKGNFEMNKYICKVCATIYDPSIGIPEDGIAAGTPFEDIPQDWTCTVCGSPKMMYEILPEDEYQKLIHENNK